MNIKRRLMMSLVTAVAAVGSAVALPSADAAVPGTPDFKALDTNGDGVLTMADDPYGPYYPGDDAVDWVGMSLYHWGSSYPWGANALPGSGNAANAT